MKSCKLIQQILFHLYENVDIFERERVKLVLLCTGLIRHATHWNVQHKLHNYVEIQHSKIANWAIELYKLTHVLTSHRPPTRSPIRTAARPTYRRPGAARRRARPQSPVCRCSDRPARACVALWRLGYARSARTRARRTAGGRVSRRLCHGVGERRANGVRCRSDRCGSR